MEHEINRCLEAKENDLSLSVTALIVVLAVTFALYFAVRTAVPDLPLHLHHALAELPSESGESANALSMLR